LKRSLFFLLPYLFLSSSAYSYGLGVSLETSILDQATYANLTDQVKNFGTSGIIVSNYYDLNLSVIAYIPFSPVLGLRTGIGGYYFSINQAIERPQGTTIATGSLALSHIGGHGFLGITYYVMPKMPITVDGIFDYGFLGDLTLSIGDLAAQQAVKSAMRYGGSLGLNYEVMKHLSIRAFGYYLLGSYTTDVNTVSSKSAETVPTENPFASYGGGLGILYEIMPFTVKPSDEKGPLKKADSKKGAKKDSKKPAKK